MKIDILWSEAPRQVQLLAWQANEGATVAQALAFLRMHSTTFASQPEELWQTAIWGKPVELPHVLQAGDRLELLRPLRVDPKVARRERFQRQGAKTAGLFAKRRVGAKPGY